MGSLLLFKGLCDAQKGNIPPYEVKKPEKSEPLMAPPLKEGGVISLVFISVTKTIAYRCPKGEVQSMPRHIAIAV